MNEQSPPGAHDLRQRILAQARRLFIEFGYHRLSMRQIADAVGVSKAALYYHFRDKEALFLAVLEAYLGRLESILLQARSQPGGSQPQVRWLVNRILDEPVEERALIRLSSQEMDQLSRPLRDAFEQAFHARFLNHVQALLAEGMARGELRSLDPGVAAWSLLGILYPYFYPVHFGDVPPPQDVAGQLATIYLYGMIQPEG